MTCCFLINASPGNCQELRNWGFSQFISILFKENKNYCNFCNFHQVCERDWKLSKQLLGTTRVEIFHSSANSQIKKIFSSPSRSHLEINFLIIHNIQASPYTLHSFFPSSENDPARQFKEPWLYRTGIHCLLLLRSHLHGLSYQ